MRKPIEDLIPPENRESTAPNSRPKLRTWEKTISSIAVMLLVIMPIFFGWVGFLFAIFGAGSIFLLIGGITLKKISRHSNVPSSKLGSILLIFSLVKPLWLLTILVFAALLALWIKQPYWAIQQQAWQLKNPGKALPKPKHFGFVFGETTFDEAVQILKENEAVFRISNQWVGDKKIEQIPKILIDHYAPIEKLLPLGQGNKQGAVIEFDDENKVYKLFIWFNPNKGRDCTLRKMAAINKAYYQKYEPNYESFDPEKEQYYHIAGGIGIYIDPPERWIKIVNNRKKEIVQTYREKLALGSWKDEMEAVISSGD